MNQVRIFFSVGEPSGDLHASNLIRHLKQQDSTIECVGYGGPKMQAAGCKLHFDLTTMAVMFLEALRQVHVFVRLARQAARYFKDNQVDAVVLIDYAGFNWWIAKRAKRYGIPVFFYGVPQMWAWAPWRIGKLRRRVDHVLCKLPFEKKWFEDRDVRATYIGHPYFDQLHSQQHDEQFIADVKGSGDGKLLVLLPGSRNREVETHLPILLDAAIHVRQAVPETKIVIAAYNERHLSRANELVSEKQADGVELFAERTPDLMKAADVCMACSGSVSLELLHHRKPTVIVFNPGKLVMFLQRFMLHVKFITLVNLIACSDIRRKGRQVYDPDAPGAEPAVMPEYLTTENPARKMSAHAIGWLNNPEKLSEKVADMEKIAAKYAKSGATARAADYILKALGSKFPERDCVPGTGSGSTKSGTRAA